jgi:hypothetical protein
VRERSAGRKSHDSRQRSQHTSWCWCPYNFHDLASAPKVRWRARAGAPARERSHIGSLHRWSGRKRQPTSATALLRGMVVGERGCTRPPARDVATGSLPTSCLTVSILLLRRGDPRHAGWASCAAPRWRPGRGWGCTRGRGCPTRCPRQGRTKSRSGRGCAQAVDDALECAGGRLGQCRQFRRQTAWGCYRRGRFLSTGTIPAQLRQLTGCPDMFP